MMSMKEWRQGVDAELERERSDNQKMLEPAAAELSRLLHRTITNYFRSTEYRELIESLPLHPSIWKEHDVCRLALQKNLNWLEQADFADEWYVDEKPNTENEEPTDGGLI